MKSRGHIAAHGKPVFYACIFEDLRNAALDCGWALGLHGSLANDMDIMAMPWTEDATPVEVMIQALSDCFTECPFKDSHTTPHYDKPNNRVVYTMSIWADFYLDINVIELHPEKSPIELVNPERNASPRTPNQGDEAGNQNPSQLKEATILSAPQILEKNLGLKRKYFEYDFPVDKILSAMEEYKNQFK